MSKKREGAACARKTSIGGQALIEGIMMRGPQKSAMAVRNPEGEMVLEVWNTELPKSKWLKIPLIRGVISFVLSMKAGYKALMRSAEIAGLEELEEEAKKNKKKKQSETEEATAVAEDSAEKTEEKTSDSSPLMSVLMIIASVLGVALCVLLFIAIPTFLYGGLTKLFPGLVLKNVALNSLVKSAFEGILKIMILVAYMLLVSLMKDIRKTFQYHGAEHKTIFCYEHGKALTVENVRNERRFHPRCGTSFLILMLLVGMFVSFFIDPLFILLTGHVARSFIRVGLRLLLLPIVMGLGYEMIKLAGKYDNLFTRIISAPGLWLQRVTVLEPTDDMIECAITAFVEVLPENEKPAAPETVSDEAEESPASAEESSQAE